MLVAEMGLCFNPDATRLPDGSYKNTQHKVIWTKVEPVFPQPKVGPVQFSLSQKWTGSSFAQPKVDPVQFSLSQKWTRF